jgi:hypothetical protein
MRDIYKNPMLYYLIAPILVGIWPLLVLAMYLPAARDSMSDERAQCVEGQTYILDILKYDPERLSFGTGADASGEFSYNKAINWAANLCGIRSTSIAISAGGIITSADKKTQNAKVTLKAIGIVQAATFLSQIQSRWVGLKCDQTTLTKKEGVPDQWDVDMKFWYTY